MIREHINDGRFVHCLVYRDSKDFLCASFTYFNSGDALKDSYSYQNFGLTRLEFRAEITRFLVYLDRHINDILEEESCNLFDNVYKSYSY